MNIFRDVEAGLVADPREAGRAGDVDLGEAVADHVQPRQQQPARRGWGQRGGGDLEVAPTAAAPRPAAGGEVAADLAALRDARQAVGAPARRRSPGCACRRSRSRKVALHHHRRRAMAVQRLGDAAGRLRPSAPTRKMPMPPMPSSGLRMMSRCSAWKRLILGVARHERRADRSWETRGWRASRVVAAARQFVEDARLHLGLLQQCRWREIFAVEGRILAHQHRVDIGQRRLGTCCSVKPMNRVAAQRHLAHRRADGTPPSTVARLAGGIHGRARRPRIIAEGAVLLDVELFQRVGDEQQAHGDRRVVRRTTLTTAQAAIRGARSVASRRPWCGNSILAGGSSSRRSVLRLSAEGCDFPGAVFGSTKCAQTLDPVKARRSAGRLRRRQRR